MSLGRLIFGSLLCLGVFSASLRAEPALEVLAEIKPWPVISRLIGYDGRLWFANSVKGRNHNSADLYSYDLDNGDIRFERHLFSQDAGRPVVFEGLLHWPFEDARFSLGFGHFMVTDGRQWREKIIPTGRIFHTHAMAATDRLIAATSAWRAHLDLSPDGGETWQQAYDHPTPDRRVSRIVDLVTLDNSIFGSLVSKDQRGLLQHREAVVEPVPGWPADRGIRAMTTFQGHVYGLVQTSTGTALWRSDGDRSEEVTNLTTIDGDSAASDARDLIADERGLWLLTADETRGTVWQSDDGQNWERRYDFQGGSAFELGSYRGRIFVGGSNRQTGSSILWGSTDDPDSPRGSEPAAAKISLPSPRPKSAPETDWVTAGAELDRLLAAPSTYQDRALILRDTVLDLGTRNPPPGFFAKRLTSPMPDARMSLIGGAVQIPASKMGRALLLFGMTLQGRNAITSTARIPIEMLQTPWTRPANKPEKYFDTLPFALWAAGNSKQDDSKTIDALITRLADEDDPLWLKGDIVGALTAMTDQRHAYDTRAWTSWWAEAGAHGDWKIKR